MKKTFAVVLLFIIAVSDVHAQSKKLKFLIGPEYSLSTYRGITSSGTGVGISLERFFNPKLAAIIDISYTHFNGKVVDFYKHDTIHGFSIMPVLVGVKYFFTGKLYLTGAAGLVIGLHNAGNHMALSPGMGLLIPVSAKSKIELGAKFTGVPGGYSFSENSFLNKGGYSFLTGRIAYIF